MAFLDEEEISYRDEDEDEFAALASELFPEFDEEKTDRLKRLIQICVEQDRMERDDDEGPPGKKGGGFGLVIDMGKPKK